MEQLAKLHSVKEGGVTTAGNTSGLNDGTSAVLMMSEAMAKQLGYFPTPVGWVAPSTVSPPA